MRLNVPDTERPLTHEGALARRISAEAELRRSVMACLLWEDTFYEDGVTIAARIARLVSEVAPEKVMRLAIEAREKMKLRHVPLLLAVELSKQPLSKQDRHYIADTVEAVVQRADELTELLVIYSMGRKGQKKLNRLSKQVQKGLALAFTKFDEYRLAKYNGGDNAIKLRDALFITHAKPKGETQAEVFRKLAAKELATPDTWEVALTTSEGANKKEIWTRLLWEHKLGGLALLRNLRNMKEAGVDEYLVKEAISTMDTERVLPFRFITAARYAPQLEPELEAAMLRSLTEFEKLPGKTAIVVDNSGSMYDHQVSEKSELLRADAAQALAILIREVCQEVAVFSFSDRPALVPARRGFALRDAIKTATRHDSTMTDYALALAQSEGYDRIIVITDEQSHQQVRNPSYNGMPKTGYFVNVSVHQHGIGYGPWVHIDGWSEAILDYVRSAEAR